MKKICKPESIFPEHRGRFLDEDSEENSSDFFNEENRFADSGRLKKDEPNDQQIVPDQNLQRKNRFSIGAWAAARGRF